MQQNKEERDKKIRELFEKGFSQNKIAKLFGVSRQRVHQILRKYKTIGKSKLKERVLLRDNFMCQFGERCVPKTGQKGLVIHHIDLNSYNNRMNNLITVCSPCHYYFHRLEAIERWWQS